MMNFLIALRKFVVRHLCLPRPDSRRHQRIYERPDPVTGRYQATNWRVYPWYANVPRKNRIYTWLGRSRMPEQEDFMPEGYLIDEVGPINQAGNGTSEMRKTAEILIMKDPGRCPFNRLEPEGRVHK
jgi:hypothetical protein